MPAPLPPVTLEGRTVRLEPLGLDHRDGLLAACGGPRDTFQFTWVPEPTPSDVEEYINVALRQHEQGTALPFATRLLDAGEVVGTSRYMNLEYWPGVNMSPSTSELPDALEIGSTWLAARAQRTAVNTEAKLLMLGHAFEVYGVKRVSFRTDVRNLRSRANIERVGARLDGVLRCDRRSDVFAGGAV